MSLRQLNGTCLTTVKAAENDNKQLVAINAEISSDLLEIEKNLAQTKERQKECRKAAIKHGLGK